MDWSLYRCGRVGHVTYAPDEAHLREQLSATTAAGELWRCLRCGCFVDGMPQEHGPAAQAPVVRRDREIRGDLILKLFAIERGFRVLLFGAVAFGVWKFASSRLTISQAINKELPIVRSLFNQLGFTISNSLLDRLHDLLHISTTNLHLIALGIAGLAVVSGVEAFALWQAKRWGEYFAMIVTSLGLPLEIYELAKAVTVSKAILFVLNLLLVIYLVYSLRLFGVRGGKHAYEARLRAESVIDEAAKAAAASGQPTAAQLAAVPTGTTAAAGTSAAAAPWPPAAAPWPNPPGQAATPRTWPDAPGQRSDAGAPWPPAEPPATSGPAPYPWQDAGAAGSAGAPAVPAVRPSKGPGPRHAAATVRFSRPSRQPDQPAPPADDPES